MLVVLCACATSGLAAVAEERAEFSVTFNTRATLGMQLDSSMRVTGFAPGADGTGSIAEQAGVKRGDRLLSVNGQDVRTVAELTQALRAAALPRVLRFHSVDGSPRLPAALADEVQRTVSASATSGMQALSHEGRGPKFAFRIADFSGPVPCQFMRAKLAEPADACGEVTNELAIRDAFVVARRGTCSFVAKATNVQWAGGRGLIIINSPGALLAAMPAPDDYHGIKIPVVMVPYEAGEAAEQAVRNGSFVQLQVAGSCSQEQLTTLPPPPPSNASRGVVLDADGNAVDGEEEEEEEEEARASATAGVLVVAGLPAHPRPLRMDYRRAKFGPQVFPQAAPLVLAEPWDACTPLANAAETAGAAVLVARGECLLSDKVVHVQRAGGVAAVVANNDEVLLQMRASVREAGQVTVPSVMVSREDGELLRTLLLARAASAAGAPGSDAAAAEAVATSARFVPSLSVQRTWEEVERLQDHSHWPRNATERKRMYRNLARRLHPDKPTGSQARFAALRVAFKLAAYFYDPEGESLEEAMEG